VLLGSAGIANAADVVVTASGDRLVGEIKSVDKDVLTSFRLRLQPAGRLVLPCRLLRQFRQQAAGGVLGKRLRVVELVRAEVVAVDRSRHIVAAN